MESTRETAQEFTREVTLGAGLADVWRLLTDPDELVSWVGPELEGVDVVRRADGVTWTWSPGGVESTVSLTLVESAEGTRLTVVERRAGARACAVGDAWDDRLFGLEVRCLSVSLVAMIRA